MKSQFYAVILSLNNVSFIIYYLITRTYWWLTLSTIWVHNNLLHPQLTQFWKENPQWENPELGHPLRWGWLFPHLSLWVLTSSFWLRVEFFLLQVFPYQPLNVRDNFQFSVSNIKYQDWLDICYQDRDWHYTPVVQCTVHAFHESGQRHGVQL